MRTIKQILPSHLKSLSGMPISSPLPGNGIRQVGFCIHSDGCRGIAISRRRRIQASLFFPNAISRCFIPQAITLLISSLMDEPCLVR